MLTLADLRIPIIAAPMAGGSSTPGLAAAVARAGGLGFLAAGYRSPDDVAQQVERIRESGVDLFGVNLFVPDPRGADLEAARAYRRRLEPMAEELGVDLPDPHPDDDGWEAKVEMLLGLDVPAVSFTFGCPPADIVTAFVRRGTLTIATVTSAEEASQAAEAGVGALVVQGPGAGGHRAVFDALADPPSQPLEELVAAVAARIDLPLIPTGGITSAQDVDRWIRRVPAVQLGTAFLDADEAGTHPVIRTALRDPRFTRTVVTRAFSGRWARGLDNDFIDEHSDAAPASYPAVNQVTAPLRGAACAAGDAEKISLWAGTEWKSAPRGPVSSIIEGLLA
ncbi:nitronate monooxygenase [Actinomyces sp. B33]|uniref:nitronate monooxygenase n=1 Tax=Actinomyces sp. B33 TaxID=2942131 RepID=UPI00234285E0|nr:nitronate monooxygenase [Actinomyces sp. B33]MDC4233152.1 nitronate monooxygenase [Actinomyces sp. B33]